MTTPLAELLPALANRLEGNIEGYHFIEDLRINIHVAILREPYLDLIFQGKKTIESRLSKNEIMPFNRVKFGDIILLKKSSGDIEGIARATSVEYFRQQDNVTNIVSFSKDLFNTGVCGTDKFWESKKDARYATFIWLSNFVRFAEGVPFKQTGQQAWIILNR